MSEGESIGGGSDSAVIARTRFGCNEFREYGVLLCGMWFPLRLKFTIY